jgi:hypothetical protein
MKHISNLFGRKKTDESQKQLMESQNLLSIAQSKTSGLETVLAAERKNAGELRKAAEDLKHRLDEQNQEIFIREKEYKSLAAQLNQLQMFLGILQDPHLNKLPGVPKQLLKHYALARRGIESQSFQQIVADTVIICHPDGDGYASAAQLLNMHHDAELAFVPNPSYFPELLESVNADNIYVVDVALPERNEDVELLLKVLKSNESKGTFLTYVDHHRTPKRSEEILSWMRNVKEFEVVYDGSETASNLTARLLGVHTNEITEQLRKIGNISEGRMQAPSESILKEVYATNSFDLIDPSREIRSYAVRELSESASISKDFLIYPLVRLADALIEDDCDVIRAKMERKGNYAVSVVSGNDARLLVKPTLAATRIIYDMQISLLVVCRDEKNAMARIILRENRKYNSSEFMSRSCARLGGYGRGHAGVASGSIPDSRVPDFLRAASDYFSKEG